MNIESFPKKYQKIQNKYPNVQILVVTKYFNFDETKQIAKLAKDNNFNNICIAENRIKQSIDKKDLLTDFKSFFIGPLQSNKVKKAVEIFDVIESVSSLKLAKQISEIAKSQNKIQDIYMQINISEEGQKFWFDPWNFQEDFKQAFEIENINIIWLMAMASKWSEQEIKSQFDKMKLIFDELKNEYPQLRYLSMWMSEDFDLAIESWANEVRLGTVLFN